MKHFHCPVCGLPQTRYLFDTSEGHGWRGTSGGAVWRCDECGSGFVPEPKGQPLTPSLVECDPASGINPLWVREADVHRLYWRRRLGLIERLVHRFGRLLDVGCYNGLFLDEARKAGWRCKGVEPDVAASHWAREQLGLDIVTGTVQDLPVDEPLFDVITVFHVVEHIYDVLPTLVEILRLLSGQGHLILETPDCGLWLNLFRKRFRYVQPDHIYYFSRKGIMRLLQRAGFRVHRIYSVGKDTSVANLVNWMTPYIRWAQRAERFLIPRLARKTVYLNIGDIMLVHARPVETSSYQVPVDGAIELQAKVAPNE